MLFLTSDHFVEANKDTTKEQMQQVLLCCLWAVILKCNMLWFVDLSHSGWRFSTNIIFSLRVRCLRYIMSGSIRVISCNVAKLISSSALRQYQIRRTVASLLGSTLIFQVIISQDEPEITNIPIWWLKRITDKSWFVMISMCVKSHL